MKALLRFSLVSGALSGMIEASLRLDLRTGLSLSEELFRILLAAGIYALFAVPSTLIFKRWIHHPRWWCITALLIVHSCCLYRFELMANRFISEWQVWCGLAVLPFISAAIAWPVMLLLKHHYRSTVITILLFTTASTGLTLSVAKPPAQALPSDGYQVLLLTLDTTRPDAIGLYQSTNHTPHIDQLGQQSVVFDQAISTAPLTQPAHLAMLTGIPPYQTGVISNGTNIGEQPALIARSFQEHGYPTAAFVSAFPLHARFGWDQGFDVYDDELGVFPGLEQFNLFRLATLFLWNPHQQRERRSRRHKT